MKKLLLFSFMSFSFFASNAQLENNSVAPNFTVTDLDGNTHDLYTYLDQGKTVVIDLFATWCGPCWNYHTTAGNGHPNVEALKDLYNQYGPAGTDEFVVLGIESDAATTLADLNGTGSNTVGDWVTGTPYPIIDDRSVAQAYALAYYPTIYIICPNRLVTEIGQAGVADFIAHGCSGIATSANDVSVLDYIGDDITVCGDLNVKSTFQNMGTSALTSASFDVKENGTVIGTKAWTGNLSTYDVAEVDFGMLNYGGGTLTIEAAADDDASNNVSTLDDVSAVATTSNLASDFESTAYREVPSDIYVMEGEDYVFAVDNTFGQGSPQLTQELGGFGTSITSVRIWFYNIDAGDEATFLTQKVDLTNSVDPVLSFDKAYAQYTTENDRLVVEVSEDCGSTWKTAFDQGGSTLANGNAPVGNGQFYPDASNWNTETVSLASIAKTAVVIRFKGISGYGNNLYLDNINVKESDGAVISVQDFETSDFSVYPNPSNGAFSITKANNVDTYTYTVYDVAGKVVTTSIANSTVENVNLDVEAGMYFVKVVAGDTENTYRLTIK